ncbi:MAG TPA: aldolase/citrate lyase family protein [Gemmata sp.]|jgi:phosphoglycerate dehydrogenase-like enzyme/2-keto-3-deoxy-L-rhamnonate aldolase RhmA|nr:aldolase/citrate lyase family protein [Gemmata sp.]
MKTSACRNLRAKLRDDLPVFGLWVTLDSPSITEMAVALGMDWVVIDAEHGQLDWQEITAHIRATVRSETVALVRIAELNDGLIKRALDIGADGVVIPWIETAEQLAQAVRFAHYPPEGIRGIGAERATAWGQCLREHAASANDAVFVVPILETLRAKENISSLCGVGGTELFFFGPADYSASAGFCGQWEGPGVAEDILKMKDQLRQSGKHCGVVATSDENVQQRLQQGFRAIALGIDSGLFIRSLRGSLASVGRNRSMQPDLSVPTVPAEPVLSETKRKRPFRVALTGDFFDEENRPRYPDIGLELFEGKGIEVLRFQEHRVEIGNDQLADANAVIVLSPRVTAASLISCPDLLALGRFGVGYDSVDVQACTEADVLLFIAAGAVDRPVAEATVAWMLALTHKVRIKDRLAREARWEDRGKNVGSELRDKTLGVIGFGGIGRALVRLLAGFGMKEPLVFDPFVSNATAAECGAKAVPLDQLLSEADFISIHCPLTEQTRNLIGARELGLMKPTAFLLNTARGGIVDETALDAALHEGRLAGAAIDCFAAEPLKAPPVFARHDNVLLAPHNIAWTHELFRDVGRTVCKGMLNLAEGIAPRGIVNPEVLDRPGFRAKWRRLCTPA